MTEILIIDIIANPITSRLVRRAQLAFQQQTTFSH